MRRLLFISPHFPPDGSAGAHRARVLGLRALPGLWRAAKKLFEQHRFDAIYITTYPVYPALIGPRLRAHTNAPLVVDLQDPWTGAWGVTVGGGPNGAPDLRSRLSRHVLGRIEGQVLPACDAVTGV